MIVKLRMCMRTHPVGDLAGHRSDHDDATRSLLFNQNAREVFGGDEGTKDAKEDLVSISAFKQVRLFFFAVYLLDIQHLAISFNRVVQCRNHLLNSSAGD